MDALLAKPSTAAHAAKCCEKNIMEINSRKSKYAKAMGLVGEGLDAYIRDERQRLATIESVRDRGLVT